MLAMDKKTYELHDKWNKHNSVSVYRIAGVFEIQRCLGCGGYWGIVFGIKVPLMWGR